MVFGSDKIRTDELLYFPSLKELTKSPKWDFSESDVGQRKKKKRDQRWDGGPDQGA